MHADETLELQSEAARVTPHLLREIHHEITSFKSITKPDSKQLKNISQKLKAYVEMVVWGDKHNSDFVEYLITNSASSARPRVWRL